ncbi:hypothetical protein [Streptomyces lincolnensis]|uniref:hypothetical protein n=1 Tax=Streptomyces lincolnensis TaxID=1915 RepID=UPI00126027B1|nr:hypothetical protein [Streptomyces lincolnensis]QMV08293.1 hypothetical protein GJU35_23365 [Streptomyces lincolnensis]
MDFTGDLRLLKDLLNPYSPQNAREKISEQRRGQIFEEWLKQLLLASTTEPRARYRPKGEEIDGSFALDGQFYLLEAKWHGKPLPASSIYQFRGKVDGKLVGTIGVFLSMSNYSQEAVDAVRVGKVLNVILFGPEDVSAAAEVGFARVLRFKLRAAAEEGEIYMPYVRTERAKHLTVLVEGRIDQVITDQLLRRAVESIKARPFSVVPTMGRSGITNIAAVLTLDTQSDVVALVETDDMSPEDRDTFLGRLLATERARAIVVDPGIERWLGENRQDLKRSPALLTTAINRTDIKQLIRTDAAFAELVQLVKTPS